MAAPSLASEFRFLCLAVRRDVCPEDLSRLALEGLDWSAVLVGARRHRVTQAVVAALKTLGGAPILAELRAKSLTDAVICNEQVGEIARLAQAFEGAAIPMMVLKGIPLSLSLYGDHCPRGAGDIDLLVSPDQLLQADILLRGRGYGRSSTMALERGQAICQSRIKDILYTHPQTGQIVELHQRLTENPYLLPTDFRSLWDERDCLTVGGAEIVMLPRRVLPLYLCVHGASHCWERLRWLVDLADVLRAPERLDRALADAQAEGLGSVMREAITLCNQWLGLSVAPRYLLSSKAMAPFIRRFFSGERWRQSAKPGSREWLRRYSFWGRLHALSLRSDWRYRRWELSALLIWPPDWETIALPDRFFWLYPFIRPVGWAIRRWRGKAL